MRVCLVLLISLALPAATAGGEVDRADRLRRLDMAAKAFAKAVDNVVATCTKCAGQGRLRREGQIWTCPKCKGTGNQVVRLWHAKLHWTMRSQAYRDRVGKRIEVLRRHRESMRRKALPMTAGTFQKAELIDDSHGVSWHLQKDGSWRHFRWLYQPEHGWAWYHPDHDGPWPESNADFGYPGAKADDFIESTYDELQDLTTVSTRALDVGGGLAVQVMFAHRGKRLPAPPKALLVTVRTDGPELRDADGRRLVLFADGGRINVPLSVEGRQKSMGVRKRATGALARAHFIRLVHASRIEGQLGRSGSFSLSTIQRRILKALAARASGRNASK